MHGRGEREGREETYVDGSDIVVCEPVRTAVGRYGGVLKDVPAAELAATVVRAVLDRTGLDPAQEANAKTVVGVALGRGLGPTGAAIAIAAALAESSLYNYANDGTSTLIGSAELRQLNDS